MTANRRRPVRPQRAETVLLLAACLVCYANGLTGNFTYDDKAIVRDDVRVHSPSGFGTIFTTPYFGGPRGLGTGYRPLLLLSDRKSTRLNSSHVAISYAVFCLKKKNKY